MKLLESTVQQERREKEELLKKIEAMKSQSNERDATSMEIAAELGKTKREYGMLQATQSVKMKVMEQKEQRYLLFRIGVMTSTQG